MRTVTGTESWLPKTIQEARKFPQNIIYDFPGSMVVNPVPGIILKCSPFSNLLEELVGMRYAREYLSLPVPKILHHPAFPRNRYRNRAYGDKCSVWYICMEQCPGTSLESVIDTMTPEQLDHVAEQLKAILSRMAHDKPKSLGSVSGGAYLNFLFPGYVTPKRAFSTVGEFNDHIRWMLELFCTEAFIESFMCRLPRNAAVRFTHGDLLPKNIMVDGSTITGIIDWELSGFYPEYWEYARMYDPMFMTPAWADLLRRIFSNPRRETEIRVVRDFLNIVDLTF
ncbi:hypothetical protein CVT25_004472 [Psilocybe cyanescens]|uniref:Aminoglycoside phosphotransferase domain-containing protein n=1 Tax=Psilocybe cyanescens TaxID=93625 RepID=A0A409X2I3_PSICY|nr:hypothetical protein CVT25_004472 [Psilocybe cyanescens]